jgi:tetratricopeptide (TPR) repeat protein
MPSDVSLKKLINKGIQCHRSSQWDCAIQCYEQALSIEPENCKVLLLHASLQFQLGNIDLAHKANTKLLSLDQHNASAHNLAGLIQVHKKNYRRAETCFKLAIKNSPGQNHFHASLAEVYKSQGELKLALEEYLQCTSIDPHNAQGFYQCGLLYLNMGDIIKASEAFARAITIKPDFIAAYEQLAQAYFRNKNYQLALDCYNTLLKYTTNKANVLNNIAIVYQAKGQLVEARQSYRHSLDLSPNNANVYLNLGSLDLLENKLDDAIKNLHKSIQLDSNNPIAYNNLGNTLQRLYQLPEAITAYKKAIKLQTDYADAHLNLAFAYLRQGDYVHGWKEHEWRLKKHTTKNTATLTASKKTIFKGTRVLVQTEQGFGDTIQFIRFLPQLKEKGCTITLQAQAEICPLLSQCKGVDQMMEMDNFKNNDAEYDITLSLMSLPYLLGTTLDNLPSTAPYIQPSAKKQHQWEHYFDKETTNVGIVWAGNPMQADDHHRSTSLSNFLSLTKIPGVKFYSLQYGDENRQLEHSNGHHNIADLGYAWDDTAAIIQHLDLVISVDTSVAHLAGAMAIPTWVLLPYYSDWRWLTDRQDTPWYPTMTLIRQKKYKDWNEVFERAYNMLEALVTEKK